MLQQLYLKNIINECSDGELYHCMVTPFEGNSTEYIFLYCQPIASILTGENL